MKTLTTFLVTLLFTLNLTAQDAGYVHTATADNIDSNVTYLDNPALNGNPNAKVLFCQRFDGENNPNPTGLWYSTSENKWAIYNENQVDMPVDIKFNIYIADDSEVATHIAGTGPDHTTQLSEDYDDIDFLFFNTYYNPNSVYNPHTYGTDFHHTSSMRRVLFTETSDPIPAGAAFRILKASGNTATAFSQTSSSSNTGVASMTIDHPLLNNNPDAVFLYSHYWGGPYGDATYYVHLPYVTEVDYNFGDERWTIYAYGTGADDFPENVWFDFIIPNEILSTNEVNNNTSLVCTYPNPMEDVVNFNSKENINGVQIYNMNGQEVLSSKANSVNIELNVSALPKGVYVAKIKTAKGVETKKLIKK